MSYQLGWSLAERFKALDEFLVTHQALWRPRPFVQRILPWEVSYPELAAWLKKQSLTHAEYAHHQPAYLQAPAPFPELAQRALELTQLAALPSSQALLVSPPRDIPGRKWQQIQAMAACIHFTHPTQHWLDWCAGKGHLGRLLAKEGTPLTCLESDPQLVRSGAALSTREGILAWHRQQDVLADDTAALIHTHHTPVALHACGVLHTQLIELAIQQGCRQLAIVPCCYNRISAAQYQPLSKEARTALLTLESDDLRLPLAETVTAGQRIRHQRDQSMAWRLGFDLLQRRLRGVDCYLNTPSVSPRWLHKTFAQYCQDLGALRQLAIPEQPDWLAIEQAGWQRLAEVRNLELIRALFRRPLELWLVIDAALRLEEQGYHVRLGTFCAPELTPRNLLLLAECDAPDFSSVG